MSTIVLTPVPVTPPTGLITIGETPPTATENQRGNLWLEMGAAGVADKLHICMKAANNSFVWVQITP